MSKNGLGLHFVADLKQCDGLKINSLEFVSATLKRAVELGGGTYVTDFAHHFKPYGISAVVIIAESHLTFHSWPEHQAVAIDLFTCSRTMKWQEIVRFLENEFEAQSIETKTFERLQNVDQRKI